jgi:hypothetical protein
LNASRTGASEQFRGKSRISPCILSGLELWVDGRVWPCGVFVRLSNSEDGIVLLEERQRPLLRAGLFFRCRLHPAWSRRTPQVRTALQARISQVRISQVRTSHVQASHVMWRIPRPPVWRKRSGPASMPWIPVSWRDWASPTWVICQNHAGGTSVIFRFSTLMPAGAHAGGEIGRNAKQRPASREGNI